jgi:hypothetical protein
MALRRAAGTIAQRASVTPSALSKAAAFPVTTCELAIPRDARRAVYAGRDLPLPKSDPRRIVVLGDTGCRILGPTDAQPCDDPARWPFARVAARGGGDASGPRDPRRRLPLPREPVPARVGRLPRQSVGLWMGRLERGSLRARAAALETAPWIVVRGNHEMCNRAGQGWWRFLDPRPPERGRDCDDARDDATGDVSEPYAVPLGAGWRALVFDSASAGNAPIAPDGALFRIYREQMERLLSASESSAWFLSHHPPLAFAANPSRPLSPYPATRPCSRCCGRVNGEAYFPPLVKLLVAGPQPRCSRR